MSDSIGQTQVKTFGDWIAEQMCKSGLTEKKLAVNGGMTEAAVRRWMNDERLPKLVNLIALCEVFGAKQHRGPTQLLFEALQYLPEMKNAEQRHKRRMSML
jgi:transcriptional regulator with XRE-family HTH domain